jgi:hypothetical protein
MRQFRWLSTLVIVCGLVGTAGAQEEKVPLDKLPKPVSGAVKKRFPTAEPLKASKETEDGKTVFEVTIKDKGHNIDVTVTPEGKITGFEKTIDGKDVPKAAADALKAKYPGATYELYEEVYHVKDGKESLNYYETVLVAKDKKKWEVCVTADGKITKEEDVSKEKP